MEDYILDQILLGMLLQISKMTIRKTRGKEEYKLISKKGKVLGTFRSRKAAEEREKQVKFFKHRDKKK